jgi:ornithine cyclodeaminase/alanine dehydrogenase-like protein (mu-crystallin family)
VLVLREEDVASLLDMDVALETVRDAFAAVYAGRGHNLAKERSAVGDLTLHSIGGVLQAPEERAFAGVKAYISGSGRAHWLLIFDGRSGLRGLVAADLLSRLRTGAASGVSVGVLARPDASTLALLGAGHQAFTQVQAVAAVRQLTKVLVWSRTAQRARAMADRIAAELEIPAEVAVDAAVAAGAADIVVTISKAQGPIVRGDLIRPGTHVVLAGSSHAHRREADGRLFERAALILVDDMAVAKTHGGDLIAAEASGALRWDELTHLGWALEPANVRDRLNLAEDITVFCSHGVGTWDIALGVAALDRAGSAGVGVPLPLS